MAHFCRVHEQRLILLLVDQRSKVHRAKIVRLNVRLHESAYYEISLKCGDEAFFTAIPSLSESDNAKSPSAI